MKLKYLISSLLLALSTVWSVPVQAAGTWASVTTPPASYFAHILLLSDGTVIALDNSSSGGAGNQWYRLTPDSSGRYANGTWTAIAPMSDTRLYFSSQVLTNGKVLVAGGEYGSGGATAEIYDPLLNTWAYTPYTGVTYSDSISKMLPNGNVLVAPAGGGTEIYSPAAGYWTVGPTPFGNQNEVNWVKLPDDSILTVDRDTGNSERYIPSLNQWVPDATVPVALFTNPGSEEGSGHLLPNGNAFFIGGPPVTAIYTPSGTTNAGSWIAGPNIPGGLGAYDAPSAQMVNGKILCVFGTATCFCTPAYFYEYDYVANTFTQVSGPTGYWDYGAAPYATVLLDLPDGTVLYQGSGLYVYTPDGSPLAAGKPVISSLSVSTNGSYHLTGTGFNGLDVGATYGDDKQMDSNYPIVRMTNLTSGVVYYARTFGWNSTSVQTGTRTNSTEFTVPPGMPLGSYSLVVIANGIASDPIVTSVVPPVIDGGDLHSAAVKPDGTVWAWGDNQFGEVGDGTTIDRHTPRQTRTVSNMVAVACGSGFTIALKADGSVWSWGHNNDGQLGDASLETQNNYSTPQKISTLSNIVSIAAGFFSGYALRNDGVVFAWGANTNGQIGDGTTVRRRTPVQVSGITNAVAISAGDYTGFAVLSDGTVRAWGSNQSGQAGVGSSDNNKLTPVQVSSLSNIVAVAGGGSHSLALDSNHLVWAWGDNSYGQVGDGTTTLRTSPVLLSLTNIDSIAAGENHSLATGGGVVEAWGRNNNGQLGDGTISNRHSPVTISGFAQPIAIAAGSQHSLLAARDLTLDSWGDNSNGQLGTSSDGDQHAPVTVSGFNL
jgi:alpha-tubulin suppressor-like RCC1 family protein